ncbi:MAG: hypothetical protein RBR81_09925 [Bacteroidales bacterium]|jgi:hypothetical protein|nr:hypothetical protein [Bacteroidales bacterium]
MKKVVFLALLVPAMVSGQVNELTGHVLITEVMADPDPVVSLPGKEYIEIGNTAPSGVEIKKWSLLAGDHKIAIPDFKISSGEFVILTSVKDTAAFAGYGKVIGLKSFPALIDRGMILALQSSEGELVHGVEYSQKWYCNELKSEGGWSLEMIDTGYPFQFDGNWKDSNSKTGGTPGTGNSVSGENKDIVFTGIMNAFPEDSLSIRVSFSETLFCVSGLLNGIRINDNPVKSVDAADPLLTEYIIVPEVFIERGRSYTLSFPEGLADVAGNRADRISYDFGIPENAAEGDILFNEVLFNPMPGDPDYIEFYNNSGKVIDASRLMLVSVNQSGDTSSVAFVSDEHRCIMPGDYYTITGNRKRILQVYAFSDPAHIFETGSLPSMPDDKGHLILMTRELDLVDEFFYDDSMHYPLLVSDDGVALEKFEPGGDSADRSNWHSAAATSGWGTPGVVNSVVVEKPVSKDGIALSSTKISPDNDGFEDILVISLSLTGTGNLISAEVFDETGTFVKTLAGNLLAGSDVSLSWDGTAKDGSLVEPGIYIIFVSVLDPSGKTIHWKKVCSVLRK